MTAIHAPAPTSRVPAPIEACYGNAQVTFLAGDPLAVTIDVGAHIVITNEAAARDLYACLADVFDPIAVSRRVAERVAALGDVA